MAVLTTLPKLKTHLGIETSDSGEDNLLTQLLDEVEQVIFEYTNRGPELGSSSSYTEYYDGTGKEDMFLRRHPVTAVTTFSVDGDGFYGQGTDAFPAAGDWSEGSDFSIPLVEESERNCGRLVALALTDFRGAGIFPMGKGNIKVVYTAGYSAAPKSLEYAVHQLCAVARNAAESGQILGSETLGKYTYRILSGKDQTRSIEMLTVRSTLGRFMA